MFGVQGGVDVRGQGLQLNDVLKIVWLAYSQVVRVCFRLRLGFLHSLQSLDALLVSYFTRNADLSK